MKYSSLIVVLLFGLSGIAHAAQHDQVEDDSESDIRAACIEEAVADEVEDGEQYDAYIEACIQEMKTDSRKPSEGGD